MGNNTARTITAIIAAIGLLAGCGGGSANEGGETTCEAFMKMSDAEQREVIHQFMEDEGRDTSETNVNLRRGSATLFCHTLGKPNSKIREIDD